MLIIAAQHVLYGGGGVLGAGLDVAGRGHGGDKHTKEDVYANQYICAL